MTTNSPYFSTAMGFYRGSPSYSGFRSPGWTPGSSSRPRRSQTKVLTISLGKFQVFKKAREKGKLYALKYCVTCKIHRPLRAHHCRECGLCVEVMGKNSLPPITPERSPLPLDWELCWEKKPQDVHLLPVFHNHLRLRSRLHLCLLCLQLRPLT